MTHLSVRRGWPLLSAVRAVCERLYGSVRGCALKAHGVQLSEMITAAKPSQQPRTESCVVAGMALRSVDREVVGRNISERQDSPEIDRVGSSRPYPSMGKAESQGRDKASALRCFRGSYRWHAIEGFHGNKGELSGSSLACRVRQADKVRKAR
jgi:hypothetical protein